MRFLKIAGVVAVMLLMVGQAIAQNPAGAGYVQDMNNGAVNWDSGFVTAKGIGVPPANAVSLAQARAMAIRAATVDARRNLLSVIKGVQIDSTTTVQNAMVTDDTVVERIRGYLQNSQVLDTAYMSDGSVEVVVGMNMRGGIASAVLPPVSAFGSNGGAPVPPMPSVADPEPAPAPEPQQPEMTQQNFTGLLVDARGLSARPAMSPKVLDESGNEVYGSASVSREYAIQQGMAGYAKDVDKAAGNPRIAATPLVIKAVSVNGKAKTNLVISDADAAQLRSMQDTEFLTQCRVMIVLD